jgi:murein DD-endopeptidase MepM/ murein hydrolase activator NlpD
MLVGAELRRRSAPAVALATIIATSFTIALEGTAADAAFNCSSGAATYTVRAGDGWFGIADRVGVERGALLQANEASVDDTLVVGDRLCLPGGADVAAACSNRYTIAAGDSWFAIAQRAGITGGALLGANGATVDTQLHPGNTICLPDGASAGSSGSNSSGAGGNGGGASASGTSYTVARGDSWFAIAERSGVGLSALLDVNDAGRNTLLVPGKQIALPSGAKNPTRSGASSGSSGGGGGPGSQTVSLQALPTQGPCGYGDTWQAARSGGRRHEGVDIFTKANQYVYAVVDGVLTDRAWDQPGKRAGNAWTLTAPDGTYYFYAHLSGFADGLEEGSRVRAGQIIGYVGATGNAAGVHLHFEVHPGGGHAVNPYPIVKALGGCNQGDPYPQPGG